jgi:phosphoglycerol geranylgeranyltransferase
MQTIYNHIFSAYQTNQKLLAILIDPEKFQIENVAAFLKKIPASTTHLFVGGSTATQAQTEKVVLALKAHTRLPVILFPGDEEQISLEANGILFLSLLSGENPEYLVGQQIKAASKLRNSAMEIIPTGYLLIDGGTISAVERVSQTRPLPQEEVEQIVHTALAGQYSGKKLIYLEAGSGAKKRVSNEIISEVNRSIHIPLIVGGGISSLQELNEVFEAGATLAVVGTAFEINTFKGNE